MRFDEGLTRMSQRELHARVSLLALASLSASFGYPGSMADSTSLSVGEVTRVLTKVTDVLCLSPNLYSRSRLESRRRPLYWGIAGGRKCTVAGNSAESLPRLSRRPSDASDYTGQQAPQRARGCGDVRISGVDVCCQPRGARVAEHLGIQNRTIWAATESRQMPPTALA